MRLVGEAAGGGDRGGWLSGAQQSSRPGDPQVCLERVRCDSGLSTETAHELESAQSRDGGQRREIDSLGPVLGEVGVSPSYGAVLRPRPRVRRSGAQMRTQRIDGDDDRLVELEP